MSVRIRIQKKTIKRPEPQDIDTDTPGTRKYPSVKLPY